METSLVSFIGKIRSAPAPENETAVENKVVSKVMELLGWDPFSHFRWRLQVGYGKRKGVVDLALVDPKGGEPVMLVEAKSPAESLERHQDQLLEYAFRSAAGICVLTNGNEWWLFSPRADGERRFAVVDFSGDAAEAARTMERYMSAERVLSRQAETDARETLVEAKKSREVEAALPGAWAKILREPDPALVELLQRAVLRETGHMPSPAAAARTIKGKGPVAPGSGKRREGTAPSKERRAVTVRPAAVLCSGREIAEVSTWREMAEAVMKWTAGKHAGRDSVWEGLKFCSPGRHKHGSAAITGTRLFFNTHGSASGLRERVREILAAFGEDRTRWSIRLQGGGEMDLEGRLR